MAMQAGTSWLYKIVDDFYEYIVIQIQTRHLYILNTLAEIFNL